MALSEDMMSKYSEHLSSYKSACEAHPELKSFDSSLQQRTIKVIDKVTAGAETGTGFVSQHEIHMEVSKHLLEVSQSVANFITESKDDVWENKSLRSLVGAYFDSIMKTLKIFDTVMECVEKAELGQSFILEAVAQFDKESAEKDVGGNKKRYEKTLKELKKFTDMGDPFDGQVFTNQFRLIKEQQESVLEEVSEAKKGIEEEISNLEHGLKISNVVFGATFFFSAIPSVALIATSVHTALNKQKEALERMKVIIRPVESATAINKVAMLTVSELVDQLKAKISSILKYVDDAIDNESDEVDIKTELHIIKEKVKTLTEKIKEVGETVANHSKLIRKARLLVLEKINR